MLGMVFTELSEMVEQKFSFDVADRVLARSGLAGTWTAVGSYADGDLGRYVGALSEETGIPVEDLVHVFAVHLFGRFEAGHPEFFAHHRDGFALLDGLESKVHTEVRKLWPEARTPGFVPERTPEGMRLHYRSPRGMVRFARGLLDACFARFGPPVEIREEDLSDGAGTYVTFHIERRA
jgi:hypothetical protein